MSWLSSIIGKAGPLAGIAASFVPGGSLASKILGGVGAAGAALSASEQAKQQQAALAKANGMSEAQIQSMLALNDKLNPVLDQYIKMAGEDPLAGYTGPDPYSADAQSAQWNGYGEQTFGAADSAAASLRNNLATRGIADASGIQHEAGNLYTKAGTDLAGFRRDLSERGALAKQQRYDAAQAARFQRMSPLIQLLTGNMGQLQQTIGGQQTLAQNNSNAASGALGGAIGEVMARAGQIYGGSTGSNAGMNRTGTNQVARNPIAIPQMTPPWNPSAGNMAGGNLTVGYNNAAKNPWLNF